MGVQRMEAEAGGPGPVLVPRKPLQPWRGHPRGQRGQRLQPGVSVQPKHQGTGGDHLCGERGSGDVYEN